MGCMADWRHCSCPCRASFGARFRNGSYPRGRAARVYKLSPKTVATAANRSAKSLILLGVGPGVVPQHSDFNNLQCQTILTTLTGAKGILPRCKTGTVTAPMARGC